MVEFVMPNLGADMEAGTLVKWHVRPGDAVKRGDIMAEVDTAKGIIDIECFETGVVHSLMIEPGAKIPVGAVMATIEAGSSPNQPAQVPKPAPHASPLARKVAAELGVDLRTLVGTGPGGLIDREDVELAAKALRPVPQHAAPPPVPGIDRKRECIRASPLARRLAAERGMDLGSLQGTGPEGAIERSDVERASLERSALTATPAPSGMRGAIAAAMAKSNREIPHYYLQTRIDMSRAQGWLAEENQKRSIKDRLLPAVLLLKAVAKALHDVPALNGFWIDGGHRLSSAVHLGFAISMKGGGLVAPAIHDVDRMTCDAIMAALRDLIPRARAGRLRSSEMTDATITVTSLGDLGVESVFGVIYPPQVALVGFGRITEQPWAQNGMLGVRPIMTASLAADHRATDGHMGAQFLDAINHHLQAPESL